MRALKTLAIVGLLLLSSARNARAYDRTIRLINGMSNHAIVAFYASNVGTGEWENDILGRDVLYPGEAVWIDLDDASGYCRFDFKTILSNGQRLVADRINVCAMSSYRVTD